MSKQCRPPGATWREELGKASGDNSTALPKDRGTKRASGDHSLTFPKGKGKGRENSEYPWLFPKGKGRGAVMNLKHFRKRRVS